MNNSDFKRLLLTNDKALVSELTKAPKKKRAQKEGDEERRKRFKGSGKGGADGGKGGGKNRQAPGEDAGAKEAEAQYRDRAKDRRELKGEYERITAEWENHAEVSVEQSKYLGGDLDHTHLVKGLDYALLTKVRTEISKQTRAEELHQQRKQKKEQKKRTFESLVAKQVWHVVVETLHPHHKTFSQRMENMRKAISVGQHIRGATTSFLPGRMAYDFDVSVGRGSTDIPRIIYISKEEAPSVDNTKAVASVLPETCARVRDGLNRAVEERKRRRLERSNATEATYTLAQKIVPASKHKAKDADDDIFAGAGGFQVEESEAMKLAKARAKAKEAGRSSASDSKPIAASGSQQRPSYFQDAGSEKYRQTPTGGQLDLADVTVDEREAAGEEAGDAVDTGESDFQPSSRFKGSRPGWVFKTGSRGLGYYLEDRAKAEAAAKRSGTQASAASAARKPLRTARSSRGAAPAEAAGDEDAYGECFPDSGLGGAVMMTGEADSDAEEDDKKKKKGKEAPDTLQSSSFGKKGKEAQSEAKKKKMTENQEWQKINHMIKNKKHGSIEELEAHASRHSRKDAPRPREIMSTPAYF